jgi:flagellar biosynthesis protein FlhG
VLDSLGYQGTGHQAASLTSVTSRSMRVLPITAGARGVGHTTCVLNFAAALRECGQRVVVLDGLRAQIAPALGSKPKYELRHLLSGERSFAEVVQPINGLWVVPAQKGLDEFADSGANPDDLFTAFADLSDEFDCLLLTAPPKVLSALAGPANDVLLVTNDLQDSIKDTYAAMKLMASAGGVQHFRVLLNGVGDTQRADDAYARLSDAASGFLGAHCALAGHVPVDRAVERAASAQRDLFAFPARSAAKDVFRRMAGALPSWQLAAYISN